MTRRSDKRGHRCTPNCVIAIERYQSGLNSCAVGAVIGRSGGSVLGILRQHGIPRRQQNYRAPAVWRDEAVALYQSAQMNASDLARRFHVSRERIRQVLIAAGVEIQSRRHRCSDLCRIVQQEPTPLAIRPLAVRLGVSEQRIRSVALTHNVSRQDQQSSRRHACDARCERLHAGLLAGLSTARAAREAGWTTVNAGSRMKIYHPDWPWSKYYVRDKTPELAT